MNDISPLSRRRFLQFSAVGAAAATSSPLWLGEAGAALVKPSRDPWHGLKMGITTYTLRKVPVDNAIKMIHQAGVKYVSIKDAHLPLKSSLAERQALHKKFEDAGLTITGGGVIYMKNDPGQIRDVFDYARDAGMPTIVCSPDPEALDTVEKMAIEYNLRVAIHNHGPGDQRYPSPLDVLRLVKKRDQRMGICMDVGHTVRINQDPIDAIMKCRARLYDFHMKDVTAATPDGKSTEVGKGVIDVVGVLKALLKIRYPGNVALEYEANADAPLPGTLESYAYMRGVLACV